jgi:hypothetical protein
MSKERELLERALQLIDDAYEGKIVLSLCNEIKELFAQPEQEQEPVAWMYEWEEIGGKEWTSVKNGKYPPIVEEEYCMRNLRPLYTAPPTREPLSDKDVGKGFLLTDVWHRYESFIAGVRWAEHQHGIGGGE